MSKTTTRRGSFRPAGYDERKQDPKKPWRPRLTGGVNLGEPSTRKVGYQTDPKKTVGS